MADYKEKFEEWQDAARRKARELTRPTRTLERAREHSRERHPTQPFPEPMRVAFATLRQRDIGEPGMPARDGPGRLTVPREIRDGKRDAHTTTVGAADS